MIPYTEIFARAHTYFAFSPQRPMKGSGCLQKERRDIIKSLLAGRSFVSLDELSEMFPDVSEMTLRRDIEYFESQKLAIKVRGGCRSVGFIGNADDGVDARSALNLEAKRRIGETAAGYLETGRSIFIDSGTTMKAFASFVPPRRYSFITTDPSIALELCKNGLAVVNIVGGKLEGDNRTVTGLQATRFLSDINIDVAFLAPSGYSEDGGFTVANYNECELKRIVVHKARTVIMLMDSSKCDKSLPYTFCTMADADVLITEKASDSLADAALREGVSLIVAK